MSSSHIEYPIHMASYHIWYLTKATAGTYSYVSTKYINLRKYKCFIWPILSEKIYVFFFGPTKNYKHTHIHIHTHTHKHKQTHARAYIYIYILDKIYYIYMYHIIFYILYFYILYYIFYYTYIHTYIYIYIYKYIYIYIIYIFL